MLSSGLIFSRLRVSFLTFGGKSVLRLRVIFHTFLG